jgi:outer membrane receptor protein involved in Fe transport
MLGTDARVRRVGYENALRERATGQSAQFSDVNRNEQAVALYAQQLYRPTSWLSLNAGARWDFDSDFGNRISPRGAVIVETWRGGTVKAIYSEALRAPTTDERTYRDPQLVLPSRDLQAESVRSVEVIVSERFGAESLVFGLFRSWWSNMIFRHQLFRDASDTSTDSALIEAAQRSGVLTNNIEYAFQYQNIGSIDNWGLNGGWEGSTLSGRLAYALNVTAAYTRSQTPAGPRLLTVTPAWFGNARLSYDFQERLPSLALAAHFGGERVADVGEDAGFARLPYAPASLDFRSTLTGPFPWVERLTYRVMVDHSFAATTPYTAGRVLNARFGAAPHLVPTNRFTALFGLQFSL